MLKAVLAGAAGAALMYLLGLRDGYRRITSARERLASVVPVGHRLTRPSESPAGTSGVQAIARRSIGSPGDEPSSRGDARLAALVEAELCGDPDVPPGQVTIRAENGRVILRGRVDHPEQIGPIVDRVRAIRGVNDVENRLHLLQTQGRYN